jgi:hypothetical protein
MTPPFGYQATETFSLWENQRAEALSSQEKSVSGAGYLFLFLFCFSVNLTQAKVTQGEGTSFEIPSDWLVDM